MGATFLQLNDGWNAEPNDPGERVTIAADAVILSFFLNPLAYEGDEGETASLTFSACTKWRLGPTNDDGWYRGQCRYSGIAPRWGEFYEIVGSDDVSDQPTDWRFVDVEPGGNRHFLFYLRDNTFECFAADWSLAR
jgi:hypothetical protein